MSTTIIGDCRDVLPTLPAESVQCVVTSPPYFGLRSYLDNSHEYKAREIGSEPTVDAYVAELVAVFREARRVLRPDGCVFLNLGDSYVNAGGNGSQGSNGQRASRTFTAEGLQKRGIHDGLKPKDLIGVPWRVAFALQEDGWYLRSDIIWAKPNPMPESVTDRPTKSHEYLFLLTKRASYYYDAAAIAEPANSADREYRGDRSIDYAGGTSAHIQPYSTGATGYGTSFNGTRNRRSVWTVATKPFAGAHFATFPPKLIEPCILAGSCEGDTVLDPFGGSGTTGEVATRLGRDSILIELNPDYRPLIEKRTAQQGLGLEVPA